ncbi:SRPBCC family protein [Pseudomonas sp. RIT-PI-S]|uniref:SRPBCC family protein n=1 Tax=Pseudomonas sp. RIT-PI-S TaxID=3035295 RepID=UPI0021D9E2E6|nr:SRPBCC family protein [Pseudomonas sp. RIT-PI-S]
MSDLQPNTRIHNPTGVRIESTVEVPASPQATWELVGDFGGFQRFITALECTQVTGNGPGSVRHKTFKDGNFAIEQLNTYDAQAMSMTWTLIHTSLPVGNLWAAMEVIPAGIGRSRATWTIQAEPAAVGELQNLKAFGEFLQGFADGAMAEVQRLLA